ncbi:PREDICTED: uncharacterized protein LOC105359738 [Ceratosolen solmsi marchali]|uniref:Uncharacterized protein LOC105359738 n=1 Tax=Ceratosolen solmsi marchali TaxID=326594 RepID=A0AAJ6YC16_9HYME|nr:PREDICTED: uncharacterized protein LOC105359738 [Ceratosolen solmsi marchali]
MKNIEIKAKVDNLDEIEKKVKELSNKPVIVIDQYDIFFNLPIAQANFGSKLKLRQFQDSTGELIFYQRPDSKGPKLSVYSKIQLSGDKFQELKHILTMANGIKGTVKKVRHLYIIDQTRIHIDHVIGLGNFIELEVVLDDTEDPNIGKEIAMKLMKDFGISENCLLSEAYLDMMKL